MLLLRNPWFLFALLLVPVIWWVWLSSGWRAAIRFPGVARFASGGRAWSLRARYVLPVLRSLAVILIILAIARPQKADEETKVTTEGVAIQLLVDRSGSMDQPDFVAEKGKTESRLQAVKDVVEGFVDGDGKELKGRADDLIGLISFARWPDTECPLTKDHAHLVRALKDLETPKTREESMTAIGDALMLAIERIRDTKRQFEGNASFTIKSQVIVLLTDGMQNAGEYQPEQAAEVAAALGVKIYTIGAAPEFQSRQVGGFLFAPQQVQEPTPIDEESLKKVAEKTGGKYWRAKDTNSLSEIYSEIDHLERSAVDETKYYQYQDLGCSWLEFGGIRLPPLLLAALVLLAIEVVLANTRFRRIP